MWESLTQVNISRLGARGWHHDATLWHDIFGTGLIRRSSWKRMNNNLNIYRERGRGSGGSKWKKRYSFSTQHEEVTNKRQRSATLKDNVSQIASVLSAPIVMSWGAPPITLDSSTATTPPSCALQVGFHVIKNIHNET